MWPEDEIDEEERSLDDADIAGTRTTLQPAHHMTSFVPSGDCSGLRGNQPKSRVKAPGVRAWGDQNATMDPVFVIGCRLCRRVQGAALGPWRARAENALTALRARHARVILLV